MDPIQSDSETPVKTSPVQEIKTVSGLTYVISSKTSLDPLDKNFLQITLDNATFVRETQTYYATDVRISIPEEMWNTIEKETRVKIVKHNSRIQRIEDAEYARSYYNNLMKRMKDKGCPLIIDREEWQALVDHKVGIVPRIIKFNRLAKEQQYLKRGPDHEVVQ